MVGWHHYSMNTNLSKLQEMVRDREAWSAAIHWIVKSWTQCARGVFQVTGDQVDFTVLKGDDTHSSSLRWILVPVQQSLRTMAPVELRNTLTMTFVLRSPILASLVLSLNPWTLTLTPGLAG